MKSYNNVTLVGRVSFEPKEAGENAVDFTVEVQRPFKNDNGEYITDVIRVKVYGKLSEICTEYCKAGCLILVNGRLNNEDGKTLVIGESINILEYTDSARKRSKAQVFAESGVNK